MIHLLLIVNFILGGILDFWILEIDDSINNIDEIIIELLIFISSMSVYLVISLAFYRHLKVKKHVKKYIEILTIIGLLITGLLLIFSYIYLLTILPDIFTLISYSIIICISIGLYQCYKYDIKNYVVNI